MRRSCVPSWWSLSRQITRWSLLEGTRYCVSINICPPFNTLLISGDPEAQGGKQEAGANHQRPVQQKPPVMPTKRRLRQATKLDSCHCYHTNYRSVQSTKLLKWLEKGTFVKVTIIVAKESSKVAENINFILLLLSRQNLECLVIVLLKMNSYVNVIH